jgi:translation initiation factor IF-2
MGMRWPLDNGSVTNVRCDDTVSLGRAVVREVLAPTDTDCVAGCYVTWGIIARSALVRVIRDGSRIYLLPGETELDVLKSVSGVDVEEVAEGCECTLRISGFMVLRGDVVETYRVAD